MALPPPAPDSTALVTGASSGIGDQFARQLAARGYGVTLTARRTERLEALAQELHDKHGVRAEAIAADLAVPDARDHLAAEIESRGLTVEILVNNAGFGIYDDFVNVPREDELKQIRLNVEAVVDLSARYIPGMVQRGRGTVINLSSTSGLQALPRNAGYGASKAYVLSHSEALHSELKGTGVTVTAVCPGPVTSEFGEANDASFQDKLPKSVWITAERAAADSLRAAERGKRMVIPGGPQVKAAFGPNRFMPPALTLPVAKRMMTKG